MIQMRASKDRGRGEHGWLDSYHSFSFADYYDPNFMGFSALRVINEDFIEGGKGFGLHPHKDMEIITYVVSGALAHKDTLGNSSTIVPGEVQHMSAGTGIKHSEFNPSATDKTHLLQIWIVPNKMSQPPRYGQRSFKQAFQEKPFVLVASEEGRENSIPIYQNADMWVGNLKESQTQQFHLSAGRNAWVQVVSGGLSLNEKKLNAGDGAAVSQESVLKFSNVAQAHTNFLLFDLP